MLQISIIYHTNKLKNENYMIISVDAEKVLTVFNVYLWLKFLNKVGIEGTHLNIIKALYDKPTASIILNSRKLKAFPLSSGTRKGYPLFYSTWYCQFSPNHFVKSLCRTSETNIILYINYIFQYLKNLINIRPSTRKKKTQITCEYF